MKSLTIKILRTAALTLVLGGVVSGVLWYQENRVAPPASVDRTGRGFIESPFRNESEWIVHSILNDIVGMICFGHQSAGGTKVDFSVTVSTLNPSPPYVFEAEVRLPGIAAPVIKTISIDPAEYHIWSPDVYAEFARTVMDLLNVGRTHWKLSDETRVALKSLLHPTLEMLQSESLRVSRALEEEMLDAHAHENAALVIGMLALQEAAHMFTDVRQNFNRMTAHLSMARAIEHQPEAHTLGRLAGIIIDILLRNQTGALEALDGVLSDVEGNPQQAQLLQTWNDALHARITQDWRGLKAKASLSLLEKQELFRALSRSISAVQAVAWYESQGNAGIPAFVVARMVGQTGDASVDNGHVYARNGIANEMGALKRLFSSVLSKKGSVIDFLNRRQSGCVAGGGDGAGTVAVIDQGLWAQFFQRHLIHRLRYEYYFYQNLWGRHEMAKKYMAYIEDNFEDLYLYPVLRRVLSIEKKEYRQAMDAAVPLMARHPEVFNAIEWHWLTHRFEGAPMPDRTPDRNVWFATGLPPGTMYELIDRSNALRRLSGKGNELFASAFKKAPYSIRIIREYIEHCLPKAQRDAIHYAAIFGPTADYHIYAMNELAALHAENNPEKYIDIKTKICDVDPSYGYVLGKYLANHDRPEAAAKAYQRAIDHSEDAVEMANSCDWLVNYYYDTGKKEQALAIAQRAAKVYSLAGLETMARLQEKMNDLDAAEDYFRKLAKRYNADGSLCAFYQRHAGYKQFQAKLDTRLAEMFPKGLKKAALADFSGAPSKGVILLGHNHNTRKYGLARHDVIVAIDGYRVENRPQYEYIRSLTDDSRMDLIVWHGKRYIEVHPELENRLFGVNIDSYPYR